MQITEDTVRDWLDDIRDKISAMAAAKSSTPRDFAATLVGVLIGDQHAVIIHVGDGACVLRKEHCAEWEVPSWPSHGEYASSTYFVTDDPEPNIKICQLPGRFNDAVVFSDGLERLALDFSTQAASNRFFDPLMQPLTGLRAGRSRKLSAQLRSFLDSSSVVSRTDDDKTLIVARRVQ